MQKDLLTIPVSTVTSEFCFSLGRKTISLTRSSLKPIMTVQALVSLQDWRHAESDNTTVEIDNDSNSYDNEVYKDEENDSSFFFKKMAWKVPGSPCLTTGVGEETVVSSSEFHACFRIHENTGKKPQMSIFSRCGVCTVPASNLSYTFTVTENDLECPYDRLKKERVDNIVFEQFQAL